MKTNTYWWIEKNGKLATLGRIKRDDKILDSGVPQLFFGKRDAADHCRIGEIPVKVKLVKI